jgi:hypothetical protein
MVCHWVTGFDPGLARSYVITPKQEYQADYRHSIDSIFQYGQ